MCVCVCSFKKLSMCVCVCVCVCERERNEVALRWCPEFKINFLVLLQLMNCLDILNGHRYRILSNYVFKWVHTYSLIFFFSLSAVRPYWEWLLTTLDIWLRCGLTYRENASKFVGLLPEALPWRHQAAHQFRQPRWAGAIISQYPIICVCR